MYWRGFSGLAFLRVPSCPFVFFVDESFYYLSMRILSRNGGIAATNCYLIADEESKQAVLFDAPDHTVAPLLDEVERHDWDLIGLWLTHGHFDHIADHAVVTSRFRKAKVLIHK